MPLAMAEDPPPLRRLLDEYVPFVIGSSPDSCGTGTLDNGRGSMDDICPALDPNVVLTCPTFRSQSRTLLSQLPESRLLSSEESESTDTADVCLWRRAISLPSSCRTDCSRILPESVPARSHRAWFCTANEYTGHKAAESSSDCDVEFRV